MAADHPILRQTMDLAETYRWVCHHQRPGVTANGRHISAISGHRGFPDLVLAHPDRATVYLEIKGPTGRPTDEQVWWLTALRNSYVVRPDDFETGIVPVVTDKDPLALQTHSTLWFDHVTWQWSGLLAGWAATKHGTPPQPPQRKRTAA